jgi:hypothetical protein
MEFWCRVSGAISIETVEAQDTGRGPPFVAIIPHLMSSWLQRERAEIKRAGAERPRQGENGRAVTAAVAARQRKGPCERYSSPRRLVAARLDSARPHWIYSPDKPALGPHATELSVAPACRDRTACQRGLDRRSAMPKRVLKAAVCVREVHACIGAGLQVAPSQRSCLRKAAAGRVSSRRRRPAVLHLPRRVSCSAACMGDLGSRALVGATARAARGVRGRVALRHTCAACGKLTFLRLPPQAGVQDPGTRPLAGA